VTPVPRVVFVTQLIDPDDADLGFVVPQLRALADRVDHLTVIANEVRSLPADLPADVISLEKERGRGRMRRGARYEAALVHSLRGRVPAAVLAHMCPSYLTLAAPVARITRSPTILWFVHSADTWNLRVAERLAGAVITAFPNSYPRQGPKIHAIGHAIDTNAFGCTPVERSDAQPLRLVAVGRTSAYKGYDVMIRAVAEARGRGANAELRIVGPSLTPAERTYRSELHALVDAEGEGGIRLEEGVPRGAMPALLREADVLVNATEDRSADKVVFEAMAVGRPVLVSSPAFAELVAPSSLPLTFRRDDPASLTSRIEALATASNADLRAIGGVLSRRVAAEHSLEHWADRVAQLVTGLVQEARR
jgi:glycosyltransferase involved in cell wall biosynthesis